jgi:hypothetical protein
MPGALQDFARNTTKTFTITGADVGENKSLVVRVGSRDANDWSALHSAWHLSKVEVLDKNSGELLLIQLKHASWLMCCCGTQL